MSAWSTTKFELHSWTCFAHYVSHFINWLRRTFPMGSWSYRRKLQKCRLHNISRTQTCLVPESLWKTIACMKIISKDFLFSMCARYIIGQAWWQREYFTVAQCITALLETKMVEAAGLVLLHLFCLNLALESWPCSLPHQSSSTSSTTTLAPGQLLPPYHHVSCPRTSTTSFSHIPHH